MEGTSETFVMDVGEVILAASVAFAASSMRDALVLSLPELLAADCDRIEIRSASIRERILVSGSSTLFGISDSRFAIC